MRIARIATVRGPAPVVQQGQEASSGPVGLILTRQVIPVLEGTSSEGGH
jgi:transketolase